MTPVRVTDFGAVGDGVHDDTAAFQAAIESATLRPIRDEYASAPKVIVPATADFYLITSDIVVRRNVIIEGENTAGRGLGATQIRFADTCSAGFWFAHPGGLSAPEPYRSEVGTDFFGAGRSVLRDVNLRPVNTGAVDFGIVHNVPVVFERVFVSGFRKAGFFAHGQSAGNSIYGDPNGINGFGTMFGNTNGSQYVYCMAFGTTDGHGFVAQGNNTQVMLYQSCDATGNKGCGFRDNSAIGNCYVNCHTAQNSITVTVPGSDQHYLPIYPHTATQQNKPGEGAQWRKFWIPVFATLADAEWTEGESYRDAGGLNVIDAGGNYPTIIGHYTEGGIEYGVIPRGNSVVIGGVAANGRTYTEGPDAVTCVASGGLSATPVGWRGGDGQHEFGASIGRNRTVPTFFECGHSDDPDATAGLNGISLRYSPIRHAYEFYKRNTPIAAITADGWSNSGFSGAGQFLFPNGLLIGGPKTVRVRGAFSIDTIPAIEVTRGDIFIFTKAASGEPAIGQVTKSGKIGEGAEVRAISHVG